MDYFEESIKIPTLNENNFQEFLSQNKAMITVFETDDYEYHYYLPSHVQISKGCVAEGKWARQYG
jgi:hypothetical protein